MPRPPSRYPTELELEILKILCAKVRCRLRRWRDHLAQAGRDLAHTSVITTLNVMTDKGYLSRKKDGKSFRFRPRVKQNTISTGMIGDLVDRVFDGSASAMMLRLVESREMTPGDIEKLEQMLRDLKSNDKTHND